jgi:hypothetical protein
MTNRNNGFARFMAGPVGRGVRILAGAALLAWGWRMGGTTGTLVMIAGLVPIAAGVFNFCLIAPILSAPFWGRDSLRHAARR